MAVQLLKVGVLIVSDRVSRGEAEDKTFHLICNLFNETYKSVFPSVALEKEIVPDEETEIIKSLLNWTDEKKLNLVLTSGGTGFSPRDVTPEATKKVIEKETPGLLYKFFQDGLKATPYAILSRPVAGIRKQTLIVNLPGSPSGVKDGINSLMTILPHGLALLANIPAASSITAHTAQKQEHQHSGDQHQHQESGIIHTCGHHFDESTTGQDDKQGRGIRKQSGYPMLEVSEALKIVLEQMLPLPTRLEPISNALGCVVADDIYAKEPLPPFRASIMDGYAVVAEDGEGRFPVTGVVTAGSLPNFTVKPKTIARITTGAPVPDGADAVVMVERTELFIENEKEIVKILDKVSPGTNIRPIGSDIREGEKVLSKGDEIGAAEIGLLATTGHSHVSVFGHPKIAILSTGDEVIDVGGSLQSGQIRDSNRPTLIGAVKSLTDRFFSANEKSNIIDLGIAKDEQSDLEEKLDKALNFSETNDIDILITSGGVSMGELDLIKPYLEKKGQIHFGRILMKPGKPLTFATVDIKDQKGQLVKRKYVFGLPGNPVSSLVTFILFVVPSIRKLTGRSNPNTPVVQVKVTSQIRLDKQRPEYHRANVFWSSEESAFIAQTTGNQISSRLMSFKSANGFLVLPRAQQGQEEITKGTFVPCLLIGPFESL